MRSKPGETWVYTDVSPLLIGAVVEKVTGMRLAEFAREQLFAPLGIREYYWYTGRGGSTGPMGNLYLSTLDFAKLGQLVLRGGVWQGRRIVSARWTRALCVERFDISALNPFATGYGYMWYQGAKTVNGQTYRYCFASGNGGNVLIVVPELDMVVALTSSAYGQGYGHQRAQNIFEFLLRSIVR
jgi:CubicO group peptidase (beta-lactamase class C family)